VPQPAPDHYAVLRVHPSADADAIKAAYLREVFRWHPDRNPSAEATARTARINAAWEVLRDPDRRAAYDRRRTRSRSPSSPPPSSRPASAGAAPPRARPSRARPPRPDRPAPDPAAAARARREAEARAREAEERRRREAEYEQRRKASEHLWQPPPDAALGWSDPDFVVGHWYRNNLGPYRVIDVKERFVDVYYPDGSIVSLRRDDLWRHWQRQVEGRGRPVRSGRPASRR
jgi:curved DNA-binding protein CbpA